MLPIRSKDGEVDEWSFDNSDAPKASRPKLRKRQLLPLKLQQFEMYQDWMVESLKRERATGFSTDMAFASWTTVRSLATCGGSPVLAPTGS
jgi:hypothetical protein